MDRKEKKTFPNGFFTKSRPQINPGKNPKDKDTPFEWSKSVLEGKSKIEIVSIHK